jgi:hypothetical protein
MTADTTPSPVKPLFRRGRAGRSGAITPVTLLAASMAGVITLLVAFPQQAAGTVALTLLGGVWLLMVLAATLPSAAERAQGHLSNRLARFRHAVNAVGDAPTRPQLEAVLALVHQLDLPPDTIAVDVERVRASLSALTLVEDIATGQLPIVPTVASPTTGTVCHFRASVRFGRRRSDEFGQLMMTPAHVSFHGTTDVSVAWSDVTGVQRAGGDLILTLANGRPCLRFACDSVDQAARAGVIADHLRMMTTTGAA